MERVVAAYNALALVVLAQALQLREREALLVEQTAALQRCTRTIDALQHALLGECETLGGEEAR